MSGQLLIADWDDQGTKAQLEARIGNGFKIQLGWTETSTDTIFCEMVALPKKFGTPNEQHYRVSVWNRRHIRKELAALLAEPVHILKD